MNIAEAERKIGYTFEDKALLERALTHSSYANEVLGDPLRSNERLEFLGDAILGAVVGDALFREFRNKAEGDLTRLRAAVVCEKSLGKIAFDTGLNEELRLGRGEELAGGKNKISMAADAVESVIAAVYLDGGIMAAHSLIMRLLSDAIESAAAGNINSADSKTELQEIMHAKGVTDIAYEIVSESGPDHAKQFEAVVKVNGEALGRGSGTSKKRAEAEAAQDALLKMKASGQQR